MMFSAFDVSGITGGIASGMWAVAHAAMPLVIAFAAVNGGIWAWKRMRDATETEWLEADAAMQAEDKYWEPDFNPIDGPESFAGDGYIDPPEPGDDDWNPIDGDEMLDNGVRASTPARRKHDMGATWNGWDGQESDGFDGK